MILDGLLSLFRVWITELPFVVNHDQQGLNAEILAAGLQFSQILLVFCFVLEELVNVLDSVDAESLLAGLGEVQVIQLAGKQGFYVKTIRPTRSEMGVLWARQCQVGWRTVGRRNQRQRYEQTRGE